MQAVTNRKEWESIADELEAMEVDKVKSYYLKYLFAYERKQYFGNEEEEDEPIMVKGNPRKIAKTENKETKIRGEENFSLYSELLKNIEEDEKEK